MFLEALKRLFGKNTPGTPEDTARHVAAPAVDATQQLTPVERAAAKFLHLLPEHGIREGHVPTAQEVERLANLINVDDDDGETWLHLLDAEDYAALWVDRAPPAALDSLLAVLDSGRPIWLAEDAYDDGLIIVLGQWGQQRLHPWLEEMAMRLDRPYSRAGAFAVLGWNPCPELFSTVSPWLSRVNDLTEPEQLVLISLFGDVKSPQSLPALQQLQSTLREPAEEVRSELKGYIAQHSEPT